jgi:hypothetical protein
VAAFQSYFRLHRRRQERMKFFGVVVLLAVRSGAWAADDARTPRRAVTACLNPGANGSMVYRGQATATQILKNAGIRLDWRGAERACVQGQGINVTVSLETPPNQHPGALAYALPFEDRTRIVLFYDRVLSAASAAVAPWLLGHVLAHEIVHILQGVDAHSASGMMKPRWDKRDFDAMQRAPLPFTAEDLTLIDRGLEWRASHGRPAE